MANNTTADALVDLKDNQKYIGCIGVITSMRSLPHRTRSEVAKESINRLCEAIGIKRNADRKRLDYISSMLDDKPKLLHSGTNVQLCVTSTHLNVISRETQQLIIQHELPNVSFASSGDEGTVDFVAYVAKDSIFGRACFVLECEHNTAKSVLDTIARGFQSRTQQILHNTGGSLPKNHSPIDHERFSNFKSLHETSMEISFRNNENQHLDDLIAITRSSLEDEPWYHGSYLSREESETRLKQDGDFLVRESLLDTGRFVLSVMHDGEKLHLLFDSMGQVRTKEMVFNNVSHLVKYHHNEGSPIVADKRIVYLLNGVRPNKEHRD